MCNLHSEEGHKVRGLVTSASRQWDKNVLAHHCHISGDKITIIKPQAEEKTSEKKCELCREKATAHDSMEEHYGVHYHSECLDDLLDFMGNK